MTTRGAVIVIFATSLLGCLLAAWAGAGVLTGLGFCLGCVLAAGYARREALLPVVVTPPAVFLVAEILTQAVTAHRGGRAGLLSVAEGVVLALAAAAPWLVAGTAACLAIALRRGLARSLPERQPGRY